MTPSRPTRTERICEWHATNLVGRLLVAYLRAFDHPGKLRLIRKIFSVCYRNGFPLVSGRGARMLVDAGDFIGWALLKEGAYEPKTLERAALILRDGGTLVDIGANVGLFTVFLGVLPHVECISIEPHPGNFCRLQDNVRSSSLSRCRLFHVALTTKAALLELEAINAANTGTVRVHSNDQFATNNCITVAAISLDELMQYSRAIEITLLKIDVEGYELPVLDGLDWFGQHRPQHVLIEFSDYGARFSGKGREDLLSFFSAKGYVGYSVEGLPLAASDDPAEHNAWFRDARTTEKFAHTPM